MDLWAYDYDRTEELVGDMYSAEWPDRPLHPKAFRGLTTPDPSGTPRGTCVPDPVTAPAIATPSSALSPGPVAPESTSTRSAPTPSGS